MGKSRWQEARCVSIMQSGGHRLSSERLYPTRSNISAVLCSLCAVSVQSLCSAYAASAAMLQRFAFPSFPLLRSISAWLCFPFFFFPFPFFYGSFVGPWRVVARLFVSLSLLYRNLNGTSRLVPACCRCTSQGRYAVRCTLLPANITPKGAVHIDATPGVPLF